MTDRVFDNPDLALLHHTLTKMHNQSVGEIKDLISELNTEQALAEQRMKAVEEAVKETRATHQIFTELAQGFITHRQQAEDLRGDYKTIIGELKSLSSGVSDLNHSRQNMSETVTEIKTKVDHIAATQNKFDASSTQIRKDLDKLAQTVTDLNNASEDAEAFQVEVRSTVRTLMWVVGLLSTTFVAGALWFGGIVMQDHNFIVENRKSIEKLQETQE